MRNSSHKQPPQQVRDVTPQATLPAPDRFPEPSGLVENIQGPLGLRTPEADPETEGRSPSCSQDTDLHQLDLQNDKDYEIGVQEEDQIAETSPSGHPLDNVSLDLAKMMVNMHDHYNAELAAEKERNALLSAQQEEMQIRIEGMEKRLQTHVVLMEGLVSLVAQCSEGRLKVPEQAIARKMGAEHVEAITELTKSPVEEPESQLLEAAQEMQSIEAEVDDEDVETTQQPLDNFDQLEIPDIHLVREAWNDFNQLPPTPDFNTAPIRSTGIRATK